MLRCGRVEDGDASLSEESTPDPARPEPDGSALADRAYCRKSRTERLGFGAARRSSGLDSRWKEEKW